MSFRVYNSVVNNTTLVHLSDNNHSTTVTVIPEAGALLHEFLIQVDGQPFNIIENYLLDHPVRDQVTHYFRSVKLSPWPCRLADGAYTFNGHPYQVRRLFTDGTALHGLLFDQVFDVIGQSADDSGASVSLRHIYTGYDEGYPFHYQCDVSYTLRAEGKLEVETTVTNPGNEDIPIADGWHPYFQLGGRVNEWEMHFNSQTMLEFDKRLVPTGKTITFSQFSQPALIGQTALDNCFVLEANTQPACTLRNPANNITVSFLPDDTYPYLQLFIPDHRQSIAVENLSSAPDCFNNGIGLHILKPGSTKTFRVAYKAAQAPADALSH